MRVGNAKHGLACFVGEWTIILNFKNYLHHCIGTETIIVGSKKRNNVNSNIQGRMGDIRTFTLIDANQLPELIHTHM